MDLINQTNADYECTPGEEPCVKPLNNHSPVYMEDPNDMLDPFNINPGKIIGKISRFSISERYFEILTSYLKTFF